MKRLLPAAMAGLLMLPCAANARLMLGEIGFRSCAEYLTADHETTIGFNAWAGGAVSANALANKNEVGNVDYSVMINALTDYCRAHPGDSFGTSIYEFWRRVAPPAAAGKRT